MAMKLPISRDNFGAMAPVVVLLALIWGLQIVNMISGYRLNLWFGIEPRQLDGLLGVVGAPFLHANIPHAIANTIPLAILGGLTAFTSPREFPVATFLIAVLGGFLTWLLARGGNHVHVGASGLIFGYFGFLVAYGWFERRISSILGAVVALLLYGGMIWGVLPTSPRVSWESHLFGLLGGAAAAWMLRTRGRTKTP